MPDKIYENLSEQVQKRITDTLNLDNEPSAVRRCPEHDRGNLWRPSYIRDIEKILHSAYYNRCTDKTQVFSFYKNDDISRRGFHLQLVSRIARNIGRLLGLNLNLIEAAALGHDMGHTPFGHAGERFLNELYFENTGRYFNHNVHSVRVFDGIFHLNLSLQTLDAILCHNGEFECREYRPSSLSDFREFDERLEKCYTVPDFISTLVPSTLEGCVVRISDMIAYIGKDRQDAVKARLIKDESIFDPGPLGNYNAPIINNLIVNIVENSFGRDCIILDETHFNALKSAKRENYDKIYKKGAVSKQYDEFIRPMFGRIYENLLNALIREDLSSPVYKHHIELVNKANRSREYEKTEKNQIVVDYIASMTDDYFIDLYEYLFDENPVKYKSYFDDLTNNG